MGGWRHIDAWCCCRASLSSSLVFFFFFFFFFFSGATAAAVAGVEAERMYSNGESDMYTRSDTEKEVCGGGVHW